MVKKHSKQSAEMEEGEIITTSQGRGSRTRLVDFTGASGINWVKGSGTLPDSPHQYQHLEETSRFVKFGNWKESGKFYKSIPVSSRTFYMYFIHGHT